MRKLLAVTAVLAMVSSASAIGVGVGAGYSLGIPMGDFADGVKFSIVGFGGDIEIAVMPFLNVVGGFGYHIFKPKEVLGVTPEGKYTIIPITFGVEYPLAAGPMNVCIGGGAGFNMLKSDIGGIDSSDNKLGIWFGGKFYYMFNEKMGFGGGAGLHYIFTDVTKTMWVEIPVGIKYWFM